MEAEKFQNLLFGKLQDKRAAVLLHSMSEGLRTSSQWYKFQSQSQQVQIREKRILESKSGKDQRPSLIVRRDSLLTQPLFSGFQ